MGPEVPPAPVGASAELVEALSSAGEGGGVSGVPVPSDAAGWRDLVAAVDGPLADEVRGMVEALPVSVGIWRFSSISTENSGRGESGE